MEDKKYHIKNLHCTIDNSNKITMNWDWPDYDTNIKYVFCYETNSPGETLEEILARKAVHQPIFRDNLTDNGFTIQLSDPKKQFRLFPVILNHKNEQEIYNQTEGNLTQIFYKKVMLHWKVKYKSVFLSKFKQAVFELNPIGKLLEIPQNALIYKKCSKKNKAVLCSYPLEIALLQTQNYIMLVENDMEIILCPNVGYEDAVILKQD